MKVAIVGAGIAGMAAAVRLAERGVAVTLLETRRKLGGRATSFVDVRSGLTIDNCQHVVMGCCTAYLDLLARLGATEKIGWRREQHWVEEGGRVSTVKPSFLPAPLHFAPSMLGAKFLSKPEVVSIGRAIAKIARARRDQHEGETFDVFLKRAGQSERVVRRFFAPIIVSACNLDVERVSAAVALHVFQEGFLSSKTAADIGVPKVPLADLFARVPEIIAAAGGEVLLGASVERVARDSVTLADGRTNYADAVILAVPVERVRRLVGDNGASAVDPRFAPLDRFTHSPILGVHLLFDRPVMDLPHAVLVDRPTQWLFNKSGQIERAGLTIDGVPVRGALHAVISAADAWVALDEAEIGRRVLADVHACFPGTRENGGAKLLAARAVKEKRATFAPVPGIASLRPSTTGPSGIILAGDYTDTGWPATMEGAARSGYAAAEAALK